MNDTKSLYFISLLLKENYPNLVYFEFIIAALSQGLPSPGFVDSSAVTFRFYCLLFMTNISFYMLISLLCVICHLLLLTCKVFHYELSIAQWALGKS